MKGDTSTMQTRKFGRLQLCTALTVAGLSLAAVLAGAGTATAAGTPGDEQYRPAYHYTPQQNWMNDPNGLVFYKGVYHLLLPAQPLRQHLGQHVLGPRHVNGPRALAGAAAGDLHRCRQDIFSGSVVVDKDNTSGFGTAENPRWSRSSPAPTRTPRPTADCRPSPWPTASTTAQTWTKYSGNPVLNRNSANFRDPKVFWYNAPGGGGYWVMAAVEATEHKVVLYKSANLKNWTQLSEFGPANATGGLWECPDLFPLAVDGDPKNVKWVMVVNINPGGVAGGSGGQYFVGNFDGTTFTSETTKASDALPAGNVPGRLQRRHLQRLDRQQRTRQLEERAVRGTPRRRQPCRAERRHRLCRRRPDQFLQRRRLAAGLDELTGVHGGQRLHQLPRGRRTASAHLGQTGQHPTARRPAVQRLRGSGRHHAGRRRLDRNRRISHRRSSPPRPAATSIIGAKRINTFETGGAPGDDRQGTLTSPSFTVTRNFMSMLVGGGHRARGLRASPGGPAAGERQRGATLAGDDAGALNWKGWDVSEFAGQQAQLRIVDQATGGWGHLTLDHVMLDRPGGRSPFGRNHRQPRGGRQGGPEPPPAPTAKSWTGRPGTSRSSGGGRPASGWWTTTGSAGATSWPMSSSPRRGRPRPGCRPTTGWTTAGTTTLRILRQHAAGQAHHARLDEQLGLRQQHPHVPVAQRHVPAPRSCPDADGRRARG